MRLLFPLFFISSLFGCKNYVSDLFSQWKDYSLTQMASHVADTNLSPDDKEALWDLFLDIEKGNCSEVQYYFSNHDVLNLYRKEFNLPKKDLLKVFRYYDYEKSLLNTGKTTSEAVAFAVVSVWKTKFSLADIQDVITKIRLCHPKD